MRQLRQVIYKRLKSVLGDRMGLIAQMSLLDILIWLVPPGIGVTLLWNWVQRRIDRGRQRAEGAIPRLIALGNRAPDPSLALELRNEGVGEALNVILSLDGCNRSSPPLARIPPGSRETTGQLFYNDSPIHSQALDDLRLHVRYESTCGLPYESLYKVTQQQRADGKFNPQVDFGSHSFVEPRVSWLEYFKLGR